MVVVAVLVELFLFINLYASVLLACFTDLCLVFGCLVFVFLGDVS